MEENRLIWQYWEFPEICQLNTFQKLTRKGFNMTSNQNVISIKVVGNFKTYDLESKIVQNGVLIHKLYPDF
jgi:hypothetical protein